jgi:hypothetical protein
MKAQFFKLKGAENYYKLKKDAGVHSYKNKL